MREMQIAKPRGDELPALLTVQEVAAALRVSDSAVYRAVERGDLRAVRITERGALRIPAGELRRILAAGNDQKED